MIVRLSGPAAVPELVEPENCTQFHVEYGVAGAGPHEVARELGRWADGATDDHVWIPVSVVRAAAEGRVGEDWDAAFSGMLGYAKSKGWLNEQGDAIAAHVAHPEA
ncbi:MAG: hypothetical protein ACKV2O_12570 [Acidimicrobiales bacterium]